jgi:hypothetical protein
MLAFYTGEGIKKISGMFFVVAMTEKTSYRGRIPVFLYSSPDVFIPAKASPPGVYFWQT